MFGSRRRKATNAAINALRPLVGSIQHSRGLPSHFWVDPYVLGFFHFMIGHRAKLATNGRIGGEDLGQSLVDTLTALSNMNGASIARRSTELALSKNDALFERGADDAAAMCFYEMKILKDETTHPLVQSAIRLARGSQNRSEVLAMMFMASLYQEIQTRLDPDT